MTERKQKRSFRALRAVPIMLVALCLVAAAGEGAAQSDRPVRRSVTKPLHAPDTFRVDRGAAAAPVAPKRNSCADFGAGFVKLEGSDTCVKIGGSTDIGVAGGAGRGFRGR